MLSFYDHSLTPSDKTPGRLAMRFAGTAARMLWGAAETLDRREDDRRSEPLPAFRGRNSLREDIGLPPLDRDGLPL